MATTTTKPRKKLTDRQKRKLAWLQKHQNFNKETDADEVKPPVEKKPRLDHPKTSPQKKQKLDDLQSAKDEGAARGFKRKTPVNLEESPKVDQGAARGFKRKIAIDETSKETSGTSAVKCESVEDEYSKKAMPSKTSEETKSETNLDNADTKQAEAPNQVATVREILGLKDKEKDEKKKKEKTKKKYFVLFVGNLPYDVDEGDIAHHFIQSGEVKDVRLLTNEKGSKGCAYVEFYTEKAHKAALMQHHTSFNGRIINVEFTCPGKKNSKRDEIIKQKNIKGKRFKMGLGVSVRKNRPMVKGKIKVKSKM